jgi:PAS domain S-box-containing protein
MNEHFTTDQLRLENEKLRSRLAETEATLEAIRNGEVDAIMVSSGEENRVYSLASAETPYRNIIEEMNEGVVTISNDGLILFCNRRFAELFITPVERIIGYNVSNFFTGIDLDKYQLLLKNGFTGVKDEIVFVCKNGDPVFLNLSIFTLPQGTLGEICFIATDITELKKHQQKLESLVNERTSELKHTNQKLKKINETKDKLFSVIGHDLRGVFTSLLGCSDLLIESIQNNNLEKYQYMIFHMNSAAKSGYLLLENLLIWARSQNNQLLFKPSEIHFSAFIDDVIASMRSLAQIKNITLKNNCCKKVYCYADENRLRAIIRNLVSNAIKFSYPGGEVEITATIKEKELEITVSDHGVGMSGEIKRKLFSADSGTLQGTEREQGTGLGLLLCFEFVEKHQGRIWVESEEGKGSKFIFTLPHKTI